MSDLNNFCKVLFLGGAFNDTLYEVDINLESIRMLDLYNNEEFLYHRKYYRYFEDDYKYECVIYVHGNPYILINESSFNIKEIYKLTHKYKLN